MGAQGKRLRLYRRHGVVDTQVGEVDDAHESALALTARCGLRGMESLPLCGLCKRARGRRSCLTVEFRGGPAESRRSHQRAEPWAAKMQRGGTGGASASHLSSTVIYLKLHAHVFFLLPIIRV